MRGFALHVQDAMLILKKGSLGLRGVYQSQQLGNLMKSQ